MEDNSTPIEQLFAQRLAALSPLSLSVHDESSAHQGHRGAGSGGHYKIVLVAEAFRPLTAVQRHRLVYNCVAELIPDTIHALSIAAYSPDEKCAEF